MGANWQVWAIPLVGQLGSQSSPMQKLQFGGDFPIRHKSFVDESWPDGHSKEVLSSSDAVNVVGDEKACRIRSCHIYYEVKQST